VAKGGVVVLNAKAKAGSAASKGKGHCSTYAPSTEVKYLSLSAMKVKLRERRKNQRNTICAN